MGLFPRLPSAFSEVMQGIIQHMRTAGRDAYGDYPLGGIGRGQYPMLAQPYLPPLKVEVIEQLLDFGLFVSHKRVA